MYRRLLQFLVPYKGKLIVAIICMIILAACTAALAWAFKPMLDEVLSGKNMTYIYLMPIGIIILYLIKGIAFYGQATLMGYIGQRIIYDIRNMIYSKLTGQSLSFFTHRKTGELLGRITYDITLLQGAVSTTVTSLMRDVMSIVFLLAVIFNSDWLLALLSLIVFPIMVYPIVHFGQKMRKASYDGQVSMGKMSSLIEETVGGIRVVKAFCMEEYERNRFKAITKDFMTHQIKALKIQALSFPIMEFVAGLGIAGILLYGGIRVAEGEATAGGLMSFIVSLLLLYDPVRRLSRANNEVQQGLSAAERIFEILDSPVDVQDPKEPQPIQPFSNNITFNDVCLTYPNASKPVLQNINLNIQTGEVVALVGRSGAGKTTLANMLLRFMDPSSGSICLDGHDIRSFKQTDLRSQMSLVTQEIVLFNDSVLHNIAYGHENIDREKVIAIAKIANAHEFIEKLENGYDTLVGERGVILSGGQRQRLSLARALLKNAPILVLDEATSSLDTESERLVQQAIDKLMQDRTVLVIAHRLSTIRNADKIVVLDAGKIVQVGSHDTLIEQGGIYAELYQLQFGDD
ncbi:lipid A export permease/ATP-binding protein MsbA [Ghiorsea bivora]|uniref:lipid A export permease/ATP-binding protein MsbA n=1 Tax=Ghiorsea bivora TaxID=1485545 RepID=UPI00056FA0CA|nr:lipid A export permease/ATP-binding protein MsbA [Ghiorsea bivora]